MNTITFEYFPIDENTPKWGAFLLWDHIWRVGYRATDNTWRLLENHQVIQPSHWARLDPLLFTKPV